MIFIDCSGFCLYRRKRPKLLPVHRLLLGKTERVVLPGQDRPSKNTYGTDTEFL